jgi:hypothetical protein
MQIQIERIAEVLPTICFQPFLVVSFLLILRMFSTVVETGWNFKYFTTYNGIFLHGGLSPISPTRGLAEQGEAGKLDSLPCLAPP